MRLLAGAGCRFLPALAQGALLSCSSARRALLGLACASLVLVPAMTEAQTAAGPQFQVNSYTNAKQFQAAVAPNAGGFVVVWTSGGSSGTDTSSYSVQGQRYAANGTAIGTQFQVNTLTLYGQYRAATSSNGAGGFVVVWASYGSDGSNVGIQGQSFAADGSALGSEFQVNTYTTGFQSYPAVSPDGASGFVVVWQSDGSSGTDIDNASIQGQRYAADGSALGSQFQVNDFTTAVQRRPAVSSDGGGGFVVVWESYGSSGTDTSADSIQGQRYASDGSTVGVEFQVNTYTTSSQYRPAVGSGGAGGFVVVWESIGSNGSDASAESVQGQRYDSSGATLGAEFQVNTYTSLEQSYAAVSSDGGGGFVVAWQSDGSGGNDSSAESIQGQAYAADGSAFGSEFQVNSYVTSFQRVPAIARVGAGGVVVVWESDGSSGSDTWGSSIQGQRYAIGLIFADGFESGDVSQWSP